MRSFKTVLIVILLSFFSLRSAQVAAQGGDLIGNGGNFSDLRFIEIAYEFLEALKRAKGSQQQQGLPLIDASQLSGLLAQLNIEQTNSSLDLGPNGEKHGINYPQKNLIYYDRITFDNQSKAHQDIFVVHELLPLLGISDPLYRVSRPLVEFLKTGDFWQVERFSPQRVHFEEVLESYLEDKTREGFYFSVAMDLCQNAKKIYSFEYYFVYCEFVEKKQGQFVPYTVNFEGFRSEGRTGQTGRPVSRDVLEQDLRQDYIYTDTSSYGLVVYGFGQKDALSWRVLVTTRTNSNSFYQVNFPDRLQALHSCRKYLREYSFSNSIRYHAAVCRTAKEFSTSGARYYFEVLTQNPIVD